MALSARVLVVASMVVMSWCAGANPHLGGGKTEGAMGDEVAATVAGLSTKELHSGEAKDAEPIWGRAFRDSTLSPCATQMHSLSVTSYPHTLKTDASPFDPRGEGSTSQCPCKLHSRGEKAALIYICIHYISNRLTSSILGQGRSGIPDLFTVSQHQTTIPGNP